MSKELKELRSLSEADMKKKGTEFRLELIKLNTQSATATSPQAAGKIRNIKKGIARLETLKRERELNIQPKKGEAHKG